MTAVWSKSKTSYSSFLRCIIMISIYICIEFVKKYAKKI